MDRGCKAAILDLTNHENDECVFRDVRCIFLQCHEFMPMAKLWSHLQQHRFHYFISWDAIVTKTIGSVDLPEKFLGFPVDKCHKITHLKLSDNKRFFFVFSAIAVLRTFVAWVYYADFPSSEAKNFGFHLKLFKEGSDKEICFAGSAISVAENVFMVLHKNEKTFRISFAEVKEFWTINNNNNNNNNLNLSWEVSVFEK